MTGISITRTRFQDNIERSIFIIQLFSAIIGSGFLGRFSEARFKSGVFFVCLYRSQSVKTELKIGDQS